MSQVKQVPEGLESWFGASKVAGSDGLPMEVYHGTDSPSIHAFRPTLRGTLGRGIYFVADKAEALAYGERAEAVFVSLQNPWVIALDHESDGASAEDFDNPAIEAVLALPGGRHLLDEAKASGQFGFDGALTETLEGLGFDGVIGTYPDGSREIVAFRSEQVRPSVRQSAKHLGAGLGVEEAMLPGLRQAVAHAIGPVETQSARFQSWFGRSVVADQGGNPMVVFHGTKDDFSVFQPANGSDGGFHFGQAEQAAMRTWGAGSRVLPVYLRLENPRRSKDQGGNWKKQIASAKAAGHDGIVYLNRYEGVTPERITALQEKGLLAKLDQMTDAQFRKAVPEARDSYIVFDPVQIKSALTNKGTFSSNNADIRE